ncbi:TraM recognition domain-containing protein [Spirillospora sp. NPDC029432]|uniref:type IV secretory system conjugative DNA transfer family protein n=1 Tax=Spirillospora sp. NPDC029432 TaxID=3154599 RepID=UPI0034528FB9
MRDDRRGDDLEDATFAFLMTIVNVVVAIAAFCCLVIWLAGQLSGVLSGAGWPDSSPLDSFGIALRLVRDPGDFAAAWPAGAAAALGPGWLFLAVLLVFMVMTGWASYRLVRFALNWRRRREFRRLRLGFASGNEIRKMLGVEALAKKAGSVRPSTKNWRRRVEPGDIGFYLGRDIRSRQKLYSSVEDVFIILAPPRQGKDVHFCAPFTIDAPGACIVTSTRSDAFTNTYAMRAKLGDVYVFDPNGMTRWPERLRWSPINGCENPNTAAIRAGTFVDASGFEVTGDAAFLVAGQTSILRCYLHAAAIGGHTMRDIMRWAYQPNNTEPLNLLRKGESEGKAAVGWAGQLESLMVANNSMGGRIWPGLIQILACFSDPSVLDACSPGPDEQFDMKAFLSGRNTLYVLGKEQKTGGIAPVVTAMMEDLFDSARKEATKMPSSRLDPPLTVELNEAAHISPMPSLPGYMGDSGGFSIALHVYLQSLSQARAKWGEHEAMIMWDNAAVRVIMGGAGNVDDLEDVSRLMGKVRDTDKDVLSPEEIRTMKFGTAVVVARSARPVEVRLTPWWKREDGDEIAKGKSETERLIVQYTSEAPGITSAPAAGDLTTDRP